MKPRTPLTFEAFQEHIRARYHATDAARGTPATFMWLIEEVGELATALHNMADPEKADRDNLEEEFADVFAWLTTLANINGINLTEAINKKYFINGGPEGHK